MRQFVAHFSVVYSRSLALVLLLLLPLLGWGQTTIASQDFEGAVPAGVTLTNGVLRTGTLPSPGVPANAPHFVSGSQGFTVTGATATAAASADISLVGYTNVSVSFRLSGMSLNATNGIDAGDNATLEISLDGGATYSREIQIVGSAANRSWAYGATGLGTTAYDGNNAPMLFGSLSGAAGVSTVTVTGITPTSSANQLRYRVALLNSDPNERWAIDDVLITGTVVPGPEINLQQAGTSIADGGSFTGFASTNVGSFSDVTFRVQNTGTAALTLGAVTFSGDYALAPGSTLPASIAAGSFADFVVRFAPAAAGARTGSVSLVNDDSNENPYDISFSGNGIAATPIIIVTNPGLAAFSATTGAPSAAQTYTVQVANLTSSFLVAAPAGFEVASDGVTFANSLNLGTAGATHTISVRLTGAARGTFSGNVTNESAGANTPNNVAVSGTTVAPPTTYYLVSAATDPAVPANYNTVANGTGTALTGFDVENLTLVLASGAATLTPSADIALTGVNSRFVLGNGTNAIGLTLPAAGAEFTALLDLAANAVLVVLDATPTFTFGTVAVASTVDYAQAGTFALPVPASPGFGSLKLTGGTKTFGVGTTLVRGNLTADGVTNLNGPSNTAQFATVDLSGNFALLNGTTFNSIINAPVQPGDENRVTLRLVSGGSQTLSGNGNDFKLFRLTTLTTSSAVLPTAALGATSNLLLGNAAGGGLALNTGTTLALSGNTITFDRAGTITNTGVIINAGSGTVVFNNTGSSTAALGTLRLGAGEALGTLTLNATRTTTNTLTLSTAPSSATTIHTLNLAAGILSMGTGLTLDGAVTVTGGLLQGSSAVAVLSFIGASTVTGAVAFIPGGASLQQLVLNQTANTLISVASTVTVTTLNLTVGSLLFTGTNRAIVTGSVVGGNANSFVNALTLDTPSATTASLAYPLGAALGLYRPITLSLNQATATATPYTARVTEQNSRSRGIDNTNGGALTQVSAHRFFTLFENGSGASFQNGTLTLPFGTGDGVTDLSTLRIARSANAGTPYADVNPTGTPATTGTPASGTIAALTTALGDFALASTGATNNPLPVELTSFKAQRQGSGVALQWATASERNSAYFEVQRSANGREFVAVRRVTAQGNGSSPTAYAAFDESAPASTLYYRLRQVDTDGKAAYSPVLSVNGRKAALATYPNPATGRLTVVTDAMASYRVLNQLGQVMLQGTTQVGANVLSIGKLVPGIYHLEVQNAAGKSVSKFVKE